MKTPMLQYINSLGSVYSNTALVRFLTQKNNGLRFRIELKRSKCLMKVNRNLKNEST